jgi:hypothetical protein
MIRKILSTALMAGALLSPPSALAWHSGKGWVTGDWRGDRVFHGGYWGGRGAWHGGYGWQGSGYYAPPYGWSAGHGGACWRWWYGQWVWAC